MPDETNEGKLKRVPVTPPARDDEDGVEGATATTICVRFPLWIAEAIDRRCQAEGDDGYDISRSRVIRRLVITALKAEGEVLSGQ